MPDGSRYAASFLGGYSTNEWSSSVRSQPSRRAQRIETPESYFLTLKVVFAVLPESRPFTVTV